MGLSEIYLTLNETTENNVYLEFSLSAFDIYKISLFCRTLNELNHAYLFPKVALN